MLSQIKPSIKAVVLFLFAFTLTQNCFAQQGTLTIKGNIKLANNYDWDVDECCFHYTDILSENDVVIPIRRDTAGNFSVSIQLEHYQQIYFSKARKYQGRVIYDVGMLMFSFFGKPGQTMEINYLQIPYKSLGPKDRIFHLKFGGDFARENNEYQELYWAKGGSVKNIWVDKDNTTLTPQQAKDKALASFKEQINFDRRYFKAHPASAFVKQQAYFNALYEGQHANIQLNLESKNTITEKMINDFYRKMSAQTTPKDGPVLSMRDLLNPNPSLKNPAALGNRDYGTFIHSYFFVVDRNIKRNKEETIVFEDMAKYLLKKHPDLPAADKLIATTFLDSMAVHKASAAERKAMGELTNRYAYELLQTRNFKAEIDSYLANKDQAVRDLGATKALFRLLNLNTIEFLEPAVEDYKKTVKNTYLKNKFFAAYNQNMDALHNSKLSPLSVFNSSEGLSGPDLLTNLLAKYKGKVVYVDAWATWCGPCIAGMEPSKKLREKLKGKDVVFVYLCMDSTDKTTWKNIAAAKDIEGENYFFDREQSSAISRALNITGIPHYAIADKQGNIVQKNATAPLEEKTFEQINTLLVN